MMVGLTADIAAVVTELGMDGMLAAQCLENLGAFVGGGHMAVIVGPAQAAAFYQLSVLARVACVTNRSEDINLLREMLHEHGSSNKIQEFASMVNPAHLGGRSLAQAPFIQVQVISEFMTVARAQSFVGNESEARAIAQIVLQCSIQPRHKSEAHRLLGMLDARSPEYQPQGARARFIGTGDPSTAERLRLAEAAWALARRLASRCIHAHVLVVIF